jgi:hypothetical protein
MNVREHRRTHLVNAAALVAPVLAFVVVQFGLLGDPALAPAAPGTTDQSPKPAARDATRAQTAALAWMNVWHEPASWPSPMNHPEIEVATTPDTTDAAPQASASPQTPDEPAPLPIVSTIMGTSRGGLATLNGRVSRVGDRIGAWTVASINAQQRTVTLSNADGRTVEITPAK